jgi:O-acetyl-ADP-ribose deacetylase (regulator of RNase III)
MPIIKYEKGDVLTANVPFIAHGVNCLGTMGAGIAKQLAAKWPASELKYREYVYKHTELLGKSLATYEQEDKKVLFHLFTQLDVGTETRKLNYGALGRCFSELNNTLKTMKEFDEHMEKETTGETISIPNATVAIPRIGAGLAGGDWLLIEEIINGCTPDINIVVYEV